MIEDALTFRMTILSSGEKAISIIATDGAEHNPSSPISTWEGLGRGQVCKGEGANGCRYLYDWANQWTSRRAEQHPPREAIRSSQLVTAIAQLL
jgi:hypothetical protein